LTEIVSAKYANITIKVTETTKERLEKIKIIPEEKMNNVIIRLLDCYKEK